MKKKIYQKYLKKIKAKQQIAKEYEIGKEYYKKVEAKKHQT